MPNSIEDTLKHRLAQIRDRNLYRFRRPVDARHAVRSRVNGEPKLVFCSNDYLGMASHPKLVETLKQAAETCGVGSGASQLITGHNRLHRELEDALAEFTGRERALYFSSGTLANIGVISALADGNDLIYSDALNHASLIDGIRLSRATTRVYPHADMSYLKKLLANQTEGEKLIVSDAVFSMDGDAAPVENLSSLAQESSAWLMLDDAHGFGITGAGGQGVAAQLGQEELPVLMATLGKALGVAGAFVAGSENLIEYLIQKSRTVIFSTGAPPALAATALTSLKLIQEESWRREKLDTLIRHFRDGAKQLELPVLDSDTPIQPLITGDEMRTLRLSDFLFENGLWVSAIRPPTVPPGTCRLRITLCADHEQEDIDLLLDKLHLGLQSLPTICVTGEQQG